MQISCLQTKYIIIMTKLEAPNYPHEFAMGRNNLFYFDVEISLYMKELLQ